MVSTSPNYSNRTLHSSSPVLTACPPVAAESHLKMDSPNSNACTSVPHYAAKTSPKPFSPAWEQEARNRGTRRVTLETGDAQKAAIRFYERAGFSRYSSLRRFYKTMLPAEIERSVFFEKKIT